jgi:hypothetical protein
MRRWGTLVFASMCALALVLWWTAGEERDLHPATSVTPKAESSTAARADALQVDVERVALGGGAAAPAPEPAAGRLRIAGVVIDVDTCGVREGGQAVAEIEVRLQPGGMQGLGGDAGRIARTDAQGRFAFEVEDDGKRPSRWHVFVAGAPGLRHAREEFALEEGWRARDDLVLARCPLGTLAGTAEDTSGTPLEGVRVRFGFEPELVESYSDPEGRFALVGVREGGEVEAHKAGWSLVECSGGRQDEKGEWRPVSLVFARSADIVLRVLDAAGRPRMNERVQPAIAPVERYGSQTSKDLFPRARFHNGTSGGDGSVILEGLPAGMRLLLNHRSIEYGRVRDGKLLPSAGFYRDEPLVLRPGESRALELRLAPSLRVEGRVTMPDGRAAAGAQVRVASREPGPRELFGWSESTHAADDGAFTFDLAPAVQPLAFELSAQAGEDGRLESRVFGPRALPDPLYVARVESDWPAPEKERLEFDLALARGGTLRGVVLDEEGAPTSADAELSSQDGAPNQNSSAGIDGELCFVGLTAASYELRVRKRGRAAVRLNGLVPDGAPFIVRLSEPADVRVVVRVLSDEQLAQTIVLSGELRPSGSTDVPAPDLPARLVVDGPFGWPADALALWYGSQGFSDWRGRVQFNSGPIESDEKEFILDEGLWWFGAKGRAADGNLLFPVGTDLVRVTPGEHVVELHLTATGSVAGRFVHPPPPNSAWLALARPGGPPIPLDVRAKRLAPVSEPGADGSFLFPMVPVGPIELRWGSGEDFEAGRAAGTRALVVRRGETTHVEIEP